MATVLGSRLEAVNACFATERTLLKCLIRLKLWEKLGFLGILSCRLREGFDNAMRAQLKPDLTLRSLNLPVGSAAVDSDETFGGPVDPISLDPSQLRAKKVIIKAYLLFQ